MGKREPAGREALERIVELAAAAPSTQATCVIGIDGPSGAGKSTLARAVADRLGAPVVQVDDFLAWGELDAWWPRFEREALAPIADGRTATYRVRDWTRDPLGDSLAAGPLHVEASRFVVVEGITCTRRAAAPYLAVRVWVDAPEHLRIERGVERDGVAMRGRWIDAVARERAYFEADGAQARADLRVSGVDGSIEG